MRGAKLFLSFVVILIGAFSFFSIGSRAVLMPLMLVALAVLLLLRGQEYKHEGDRSGFWLMTVTGLFILAMVISQVIL